MKHHGPVSGHDKTFHRVHRERPTSEKELDSLVKSAHDGHDHQPIKPRELDGKDRVVAQGPSAPKVPYPGADLAREDKANFPGQQEQD